MPNDIFNVLFFALGLTAGMDSIGIAVGKIDASIFTVILAITILLKIILQPRLEIDKKTLYSPISIYFLMIYISTMVGFFSLGSMWNFANINYCISFTVGVFGLYFAFSNSQKVNYTNKFMIGLKINCIIQLVWGLVQFFLCQYASISLNGLLNLRNASSVMSPMYQVTGLGWERAEFCLLLSIGFLIYNNIYLKLLFCFCIILTQSRTGLLLIFVIIICSIDYKNISSNLRKIKFTNLLSVVFIIFILFPFRNNLLHYISIVADRIIHMRSDGSGNTHLFYFESLSALLKNNSLFNVLFGFGPGSSGYPYWKSYNFNPGIAWNVESTWITVFWSTGLVGFAGWITWFIEKIIKTVNDKKVFPLLAGILVAGLFYTLLPGWSFCTLLLFVNYSECKTKSINSCDG